MEPKASVYFHQIAKMCGATYIRFMALVPYHVKYSAMCMYRVLLMLKKNSQCSYV